MSLDLFMVLFCSVCIALLGLLIFARNPSQANNKRFAFVSLALITWTIFNYLSDNAVRHNLLFTRLTFFAGALSIYALVEFASNFPTKSVLDGSKFLRLHSIATVVLIPVIFTPAFIESVSVYGSPGRITTSYLYPLFIIYVLYSLSLYLVIVQKQRTSALGVSQKQQLAIVFRGIILYSLAAVLFNVLIPLAADNWSSSRFGPLATLILVALVAYAIVRHRLFDVKFVIVRSLGYISALVVLAALTFLSLTALSKLFDTSHIGRSSQIDIFVLVTLLLAVVYQPFKRLFDRLTNKFFYRDAYDPQALLNEFNKAIVSTIVLDELLQHACSIIDNFIKPESSAIFINASQKNNSLVVPKGIHIDMALLKKADEHMHKTPGLLVTDFLDENDIELKNKLQNASIGVLVQIQDDISITSNSLGYVILGYKKSGNVYNSLDVSTLGIVTNELAIAARNAIQFEEIQEFNATLEQRIDNATLKLRKTNEKLRILDQTKDEFISMASHQLRTPLTSVKGYLSMVLEGDAGNLNKNQRKLLEQSFVSSQRMVYLISDLLNLSRLNTGRFVIESTPIDLSAVVQDEVNQLAETAKSRELKLVYHHPEHFPMLMLDENKIHQVVMNFLDNAIYYTPSGGTVTVDLHETPTSVVYTVTDTGIGVPRSVQHKLFTKFYRAQNAQQARPDGTGLGLFMAKKVIAAQGGSLIFESVEGKGSTFGFRFSKSRVRVPAEKESADKAKTAPSGAVAK